MRWMQETNLHFFAMATDGTWSGRLLRGLYPARHSPVKNDGRLSYRSIQVPQGLRLALPALEELVAWPDASEGLELVIEGLLNFEEETYYRSKYTISELFNAPPSPRMLNHYCSAGLSATGLLAQSSQRIPRRGMVGWEHAIARRASVSRSVFCARYEEHIMNCLYSTRHGMESILAAPCYFGILLALAQ